MANAQTPMIPVDPAGQSQSFQVQITENELPWDAYNWDVPGLNSPRYAPNLDHTWRLLANPYFRSADLKFTYFNLNETQLGDLDFVELGYHGATPEHQMIGLLPPATARSITWRTGMDMHDPGLALRFFSGGAYPLSDPLGMWFETEGDGFSIDEVCSCRAPGPWTCRRPHIRDLSERESDPEQSHVRVHAGASGRPWRDLRYRGSVRCRDTSP